MQALVLQAGRTAEVDSHKLSHRKFASVVTSLNLIKKKKKKQKNRGNISSIGCVHVLIYLTRENRLLWQCWDAQPEIPRMQQALHITWVTDLFNILYTVMAQYTVTAVI